MKAYVDSVFELGVKIRVLDEQQVEDSQGQLKVGGIEASERLESRKKWFIYRVNVKKLPLGYEP